MNREKRKLLRQQRLKEAGLESEDQLLDLLTEKDPRLTQLEWSLAKYRIATAQERREIVVSLSNWACTKKWAWDILVELCHREAITPILKDAFMSPVLRGERKPPEETHGDGRTPNDAKDVEDPDRNFNILIWVRILTKDYCYTVEDAQMAIAKKINLSYDMTKKAYQKAKNERPFKKSKKRTPL